ncbi:MAG: hypothetical protein JSR19_03680 [Proteobacteria bacterium]|nr:hypothetical protein [Pseudomonadota bacterium]HQR03435.1 hypothetical protein [Rhodocyclaceae bacterium]
MGELLSWPMQLLRWRRSRQIQRKMFNQTGCASAAELIIYLVPGIQRVTGGGLQIFALQRMTRELYRDTGTRSVLCWLSGEGWSDHHFDGFDNNEIVFLLEQALAWAAPDCRIMIHLPEYAAVRFCNDFGWERLAHLRKKHGLRLNILQQNVEVMPNPAFIRNLLNIFPDLSSTIANPAWGTVGERQRLGIPLHYLPTWYYPDDAAWQPYESKENLMIVSPDASPHRDRVLDAVKTAFPDLRIQIIWGLKYEDYLKLERVAKWSVTFGEGLDGYFYGPSFRGGVAFAVRNGTFDIPGLENKTTIYDSYEEMAARMVEDMKRLDRKDTYEAYNRSVRGPLNGIFGRDLTVQALAAFYRGERSIP